MHETEYFTLILQAIISHRIFSIILVYLYMHTVEIVKVSKSFLFSILLHSVSVLIRTVFDAFIFFAIFGVNFRLYNDLESIFFSFILKLCKKKKKGGEIQSIYNILFFIGRTLLISSYA